MTRKHVPCRRRNCRAPAAAQTWHVSPTGKLRRTFACWNHTRMDFSDVARIDLDPLPPLPCLLVLKAW